MRIILAIAGRELRAFFLTPGGYIIIAFFLLISGWIFLRTGFRTGDVSSMRSVFSLGTQMFAFIAPALTMRLFSDEFRMGTWETLVTSPCRDSYAVAGKFIAAMAFLVIMVLPVGVMVGGLEMYGRPDYGELSCGLLGLFLAGCAYVSSGLFASTLTASQPVAFLLSVFFWIALALSTKLLPAEVGDPWARLFFALDPELRLRDFAIGLIDTANIAYFLGITVLFLLASVQSLSVRRWN